MATEYFSKPNEPQGYTTICADMRIANPYPYLSEYQAIKNSADNGLCLAHDEKNQHDTRAVCICEYNRKKNIISKVVGYLPSDVSALLIKDSLLLTSIKVQLKSIWVGDHTNSTIVSFYIYAPVGSVHPNSLAFRALNHYESFGHLGDFPFEQTIDDYQAFFEHYQSKISGGMDIVCPRCRTKFAIRKYATLGKRKCPKCELEITLKHIDRHMEFYKDDILEYINPRRSTGCLIILATVTSLCILIICAIVKISHGGNNLSS